MSELKDVLVNLGNSIILVGILFGILWFTGAFKTKPHQLAASAPTIIMKK